MNELEGKKIRRDTLSEVVREANSWRARMLHEFSDSEGVQDYLGKFFDEINRICAFDRWEYAEMNEAVRREGMKEILRFAEGYLFQYIDFWETEGRPGGEYHELNAEDVLEMYDASRAG